MDKIPRSFNIKQPSRYFLPALVFMLGMQLMRTLIPGLAWYLRDTVGTPTLQLIPYAFGTFFLGFLAALLRRMVGDRASLWITGGGVALIRMIEQISMSPAFDLWLSIAGMGLFLNFLPIYIGHLRALGARTTQQWVYGLVIGLATDIGLRGVFGARDLSTISSWIPIVTVAIIFALILWLLWREPVPRETAPSEIAWNRALPLLTIGPYLVIQVLFFSSQGYLEEVAGLSPPLGFMIVMLGFVVAAIGIAWGFSQPHLLTPLLALGITVFLVWALYPADQAGTLIVVTSVLGQFLLGWGLAVVAQTSEKAAFPGLGRSTVMVAGGMLLFLILVFAYYVAQDIALPFPRHMFPAAAGGFCGLLMLVASAQVRTSPMTTTRDLTAPAMATILALVPLVYWVVQGPEPTAIQPSGTAIGVMSYNIHSGFGYVGRQDLEAIAKVIEESNADIVGLQEVSRVRLLDGGADLPYWLSRRLDMPYIFQGTDEPNWGNAILSRYPILESGSGELPRVGTLIGRGFLWARIDVGGPQPLLVIDTHLHHLGPDSAERQKQVPVLLDFWGGQPYSILLGDLNAEPDSLEMSMIAEAGLSDVWDGESGPGNTYASGSPVKRIDWIWHTDDLHPIEIQVIQTQASDHMPVLVVFEDIP